MRLIDADALKAWLKTIPLKDLSDGRGICRVIMEHDFAKAIKNMPAECIVDAVEVVRCKDCEHSCKSHSTDYLLCEVWETPTGTMARVNPMGYCYEATQKGEVYE